MFYMLLMLLQNQRLLHHSPNLWQDCGGWRPAGFQPRPSKQQFREHITHFCVLLVCLVLFKKIIWNQCKFLLDYTKSENHKNLNSLNKIFFFFLVLLIKANYFTHIFLQMIYGLKFYFFRIIHSYIHCFIPCFKLCSG